MTDIKRVGDTGIHTVEGNIAGNRANRLTKQRDKQKADYEAAKNKIKEQNAAGVGRIDDKFSAATDSLEQEFRRRTVGLVTADDFRKAKAETEDVKIDKDKFSQQREQEAAEKRKKDRASKRKKMASSLSFTVFFTRPLSSALSHSLACLSASIFCSTFLDIAAAFLRSAN